MKSVIVTGANRGIGRETALSFARAGHKVFATVRNPATATQLKEIIYTESLPISISIMDVDNDESVAECINTILQQNGPVDVLVNNAGIEHHGSVEELTLDEIRAIMETNYFGAVRCVKAILPEMRKNWQGCIMNVTSVAGKIASTPLGAYSASKFALEAISESLAQELKPFNVRVAIVEPGIIDTQMARNVVVGHSSIYIQSNRFGALFAASLRTPAQAKLVGDKMLEIVESGTWQLRYPVGPDAKPFLDWRASMSDEDWVAWNSASDEEWFDAVQRDFGLNVRQELIPSVN